jgi:hypothetical protein
VADRVVLLRQHIRIGLEKLGEDVPPAVFGTPD